MHTVCPGERYYGPTVGERNGPWNQSVLHLSRYQMTSLSLSLCVASFPQFTFIGSAYD